MSYSRYSNSVWYTYPKSSNALIADDEEFCISSVQDFTYSQMRDDIVGCIRFLWEQCSWASIGELRELALYMYFFMSEIEFKYSVEPRLAEDLHDKIKKELDEIEWLYRDELPQTLPRIKGMGGKRK